MFKQKVKLFCIILVTILLLSTFSFATDTSTIQPRTTVDEISNSISDENTITTNETTMPPITYDDIYLMGTDVVMDKYVEGNVYLFGSNITVSGQATGNLFAFGNNITFTQDCAIGNSVYVFGNTVSVSGQMTDLYIACSACTITNESYIYRDFRSYSNTINFCGNVQRNAHIMAQKLTFTQDKDFVIYGNLNYYSPEEVSVPTQVVQGDVNYTHISNSTDNQNKMTFSDYLVSFCTYILTAMVLYLFFAKATPKFVENSSKFASTKSLLALAIGFLVLIGVPIFIIILFMISIGITLGFILLALYIALLLCASSVVSISISKKIIDVRKFDNKYMNVLVVALVSAMVWVIKSLPFIGGILNFVIILVGLGIITISAFSKKEEKSIEKTVEETK